jgi:hypothetical protein
LLYLQHGAGSSNSGSGSCGGGGGGGGSSSRSINNTLYRICWYTYDRVFCVTSCCIDLDNDIRNPVRTSGTFTVPLDRSQPTSTEEYDSKNFIE